MIQILVLAAMLTIGGAVEKAKIPIEKVKLETKNVKDDPLTLESSLNSEPLGINYNIWDTRKSVGRGSDLTEEENRIVQDVYSPDYYEPNIILDYRYLKSGGRGYTRSDGGQILILPKRTNNPIPGNDYDTLIEFLRLKRLEEVESNLGKYLTRERADNAGSRIGPNTYYDYLDEIGDASVSIHKKRSSAAEP